MGGQGGFFSSPTSTLQVPSPVQLYPGAQGLAQSLVQYFQNLLSGANRTSPYKGYYSVYGSDQPTLNQGNQMSFNSSFPGITTAGTPGGSASSGGSSTPSAASFQDMINQAVASAIGGAAPPATQVSTKDAGGGQS